MIIAVFTPHGGCPERCTFCDQKTSGGSPISKNKLISFIEEHLCTNQTADEIAFYGGTFTAMPKNVQISYLEVARDYIEKGRVKSVRISTRPDAINPFWCKKLFDEYYVKTIELGVQSFCENTLKRLGRSHSNQDVEKSLFILKNIGFKTSLHLMIGNPSESKEDSLHLAQQFLDKLRPNFLRIHPLLVIEETPLYQEFINQTFVPIELDAAIEWAADLKSTAEGLGISVIRTGLQPNELLNQKVVAGAYHPAFGELVTSLQLRKKIELDIILLRKKTPKIENHKEFYELRVFSNKLSQVIGHKRSNIKYLCDRFSLPSLPITVVKTWHDEIKPFEVRLRNSNRTS